MSNETHLIIDRAEITNEGDTSVGILQQTVVITGILADLTCFDEADRPREVKWLRERLTEAFRGIVDDEVKVYFPNYDRLVKPEDERMVKRDPSRISGGHHPPKADHPPRNPPTGRMPVTKPEEK